MLFRSRAIFRLVDHGGEMRNRNARIERVADDTAAHERVIHFQVMLSVPTKRAESLTAAKSKRFQSTRQAIASRSQLGVTDAQYGSAGIRADNLAISRPFGGVIEKLINGQCIGLHSQAKYVKVNCGPRPPRRRPRVRP